MKTIMFAIAAVFAFSTVSFANDAHKVDCKDKANHDKKECAEHK